MRFARREGRDGQGGRGGNVAVPVSDRWRQVFRVGEAELRGFTKQQLAAVSLQLDAMPQERGPVLRSQTLPADGSAPGVGSASAGDPAAIGALERDGFVRPWPPAPPDGPIAEELPGWADSPTEGRRQVALAGDLAIITSTLARPAWIAEMSASTDPTWPDPDDTDWSLVARVYARYTPPSALLERPARPDGTSEPYVLVRDDRMLHTFVDWCTAGAQAAGGQEPAVAADTAEVAGSFTRLTRVSVALPDGAQVRLRNLIVAAGNGGQWMLEGRYWERAVSVSPDGLGERLSAIVGSAA
jgi:hypothetical protein